MKKLRRELSQLANDYPIGNQKNKQVKHKIKLNITKHNLGAKYSTFSTKITDFHFMLNTKLISN